jgi:hypothetical protein
MKFYDRLIDVLLIVFSTGIVFILVNRYFKILELPKNILSISIMIDAMLFLASALIKKKLRTNKIIDNH